MLWAIDVGNTHSVYGVHDGEGWRAVWRLPTDPHSTEDALAATLSELCRLADLPFRADRLLTCSVVPAIDLMIERLSSKWLGCDATFVRSGADLGLTIDYQPSTAVGADRIVNAIAALARWSPPLIVVDLGTAITFDVIDERSVYLGGAIMPGLEVATEALQMKTAKLPQIPLRPPTRAVGKTTVESLQSGIMLGVAGAVDALVARISRELRAEPTVIATGGQSRMIAELCSSIDEVDERLTLEGLRLAAERIG